MVATSVPHLDVDLIDEWADESELPAHEYRLHRDRMPVSSHNAARRTSHRSKPRRRPHHGRTVHDGVFRRRRHRG